jgi:O-antigen biosynthesis protein
MRWLWNRGPKATPIPSVDIVGQFGYVYTEPFGPNPETAEPRSINWFIPQVGRGAGGHLTIFRFVRYLEAAGFKCRIIICNDRHAPPPEVVKTNIDQWFFPLKAEVYNHPQQDIPAATISVATAWQTAYPVRAFRGSQKRCYFVQDYEPFFYSPGTEFALAEETYRFGFFGVTAGDWLAEKLHREFGMTTRPFRFSYDADIYKPAPRRDDTRRIFFYSRPPTARRAFELGVLAINKFAERHPEVGICLAGWDLSNYVVPFPALKAGLITVHELADLYTQCDASLVISLTNASLIPLEAMASGSLVVSNRGPNVEWLIDDKVALLVDMNVEGIVAGLEKAVFDRSYREKTTAAAFDRVRQTDWGKEGAKVVAVFNELVA